ncbi:MAG: hypothetical protein JNK58_11845 [Phycisphaerae bacterium]|nr:hypothetical protein [Phycisphaerae bacterium]
MLLTLSAKSVWNADRTPGKGVSPADLPTWARNELGVHGLTLQTSLLAGWEMNQFDRLRDNADKAGAPCLVLVEDKPLALADPDESTANAAIDRAERVLRVANRLGCSSVAISLHDASSKASIEVITPRLKSVLSRAERLELNLLIAPAPGLTDTPEKLTGLIRKVGGFRIGSFPDFEAASKSSDPIAYLRSLAPYAACVSATVLGFDAKGKHKGYDLGAFLEAIQSVGFEQALTLDFRGKGDPIPTLLAAKAAIDSCLAMDEDAEPDLDDLDDDEEAEE